MNSKPFRFLVALAAIVVALGASAFAANANSGPGYCDPLGGCPFLKVSPSIVNAGHAITVSGSVGSGCRVPGQATIYSRAFKGATRSQFAGLPAIFIRTHATGKFSKRVTIRRTIKPGRYHVGGRCGGGNFGSTTLRVH